MTTPLSTTTVAAIAALAFVDAGLGVQCIAHRGACRVFPENTIEALDAAWDAGADVVEVDIRPVKDGTLVLFHDHAINDRRVDGMTCEQLQAETPDRDVPKLAGALAACTKMQTLLLDLKEDSPEFMTNLVTVIRSAGPSCPRLIFQSRSLSFLEKLPQHFESPVTLYLTSLEREIDLSPIPSPNSLATMLSERGLSGVSVKGRQFIDRRYVEAFQKQGFLFNVWTINPVDRIRHYVSLGVDGIITDFPGLLTAEKAALTRREATRRRVLTPAAEAARVAQLETEIATLKKELSELKAELDELQTLKTQFEPVSELLEEPISNPVVQEDYIGPE